MMNKYLFLFLMIVVLGCTEEKITTREYPRVETLSVGITADGVVFRGDVFSKGNNSIADHGFTWSTGYPNIHDSPKISLGNRSTIGQFQTVINASNFDRGRTYTVRAFVISGEFEVYGTVQTFVVK
jgi:hypothetical protein